MKRNTKTVLLMLGFVGFMVLIIAGTLMDLPNWFGILALGYAGVWLFAAYHHWPKVFNLLYGGGSLQEAEQEVKDEE